MVAAAMSEELVRSSEHVLVGCFSTTILPHFPRYLPLSVSFKSDSHPLSYHS